MFRIFKPIKMRQFQLRYKPLFFCLFCMLSNTSLAQNEININFSGHIYAGLDYNNCNADNKGLVLLNRPLTLEIQGRQPILLNTGITGEYAVAELSSSNIFNITPNPIEDINYLNGISTFDLALIQNHILGTTIMNCPFGRIAIDVNNSGSVTIADVLILQSLILGNTTELPFNWRIIPCFIAPKSIDFQHINSFSDEFWSTDAASPFDAKLRLLNVDYDYLGDDAIMPNETTWTYGIRGWSFFPDNPIKCQVFQYDFVAVKVGDANNSAALPASSLTEAQFPNFSNIMYKTNRIVGENAIESLEVVVKVKSSYPLEAYQFGININREIIQLNNIQSVEENFEQTLKDNYNTQLHQLQAGFIRTSWINDYEKQEEGVDISEFTEIIRADITLLENITAETDMSKIVFLDSQILPYEFISDLKLLNEEEIEILIEIRPKN